MSKYSDKNILFLSPKFFDYEKKIEFKLKDLGMNVYYYDERSISSKLGKAILKIHPSILHFKTKRYYSKILKKCKEINFDYVLIIKAEMTPISFLKELKRLNPETPFILYLWDSIKNNKVVEKKILIFDYVFSFDVKDTRTHTNIVFRPLFFVDDFSKEAKKIDFKYIIAFIGTLHSDRNAIITKLQKSLKFDNNEFYKYSFIHSKLLYLVKKIFISNYRNTKMEDFNFIPISLEEAADIISDTLVILDIQHPGQTGLTIRVLEALGMRKKLITTNHYIKKYDFYNENNIFIMNRNDPKVPREFFNKEYVELSSEVYRKYSIESWISDLLKERE